MKKSKTPILEKATIGSSINHNFVAKKSTLSVKTSIVCKFITISIANTLIISTLINLADVAFRVTIVNLFYRFIDTRANEKLTKEEFMKQKELFLKEQARTESFLNDNKSSAHSWLELAENFLNTVFYARDAIKNGSPEEKRSLIISVGENLLLEAVNLKFSFKKPYNILLLPEYRTNVLPAPCLIITPNIEAIIEAFQKLSYIGVMKQRWEEIKKLKNQTTINRSTVVGISNIKTNY